MKKAKALLIIILLLNLKALCQTKELAYGHKLSVVSGLNQPLILKGFNIAANYTTNRWIFEYSHGMFLHYTGPAMRAEYKGKVNSIMSPYSTGPGVGYRFFAGNIIGMDLRAEAKVHQYNVELNDALSIKYTNFDLGGGLYTQIHPFGKRDNFLRGFVIEPSLRYWKNVGSTLKKNYTYSTSEGNVEAHNPYPLNFFMNISVGYTFGANK